MNKTKYLIASSAVVLSLLVSAPAFADSVNLRGDTHLGLGVGFGSLIRAHVDADSDVHSNVNSNDNDADDSGHKGEHKDMDFKGKVTAGTVSSVNGSTFVIDPIRNGEATTTVTTSSSTVFRLNGVATTSAALTAGAHVFVIGTTTATSSSGNTVDASVVIIFTKMFGFFRHWMHVR